MPYQKFDRDKLAVKKLTERKNKIFIENDSIPCYPVNMLIFQIQAMSSDPKNCRQDKSWQGRKRDQ